MSAQQGPPHGLPRQVVRGAIASEHAIALVCNALLLVSGVALLLLLTTVVVMRYGFESGLSFAPDLSELLFAIFVMAGIAQAARQGAHVATQLLVNALQGAAQRIVVVCIHLATAGAYLLLAWVAVQNAIIAHDQTTPVLHIPWSVGYGCLAAGLALVAVCSLTSIVRYTLGAEPIHVSMAPTEEAAA